MLAKLKLMFSKLVSKVVKKNGISVVDEVIADFQKKIDTMKQGVELCDKEVEKNNFQIAELNASNNKINSAKERGKKFIENLSKFLPS